MYLEIGAYVIMISHSDLGHMTRQLGDRVPWPHRCFGINCTAARSEDSEPKSLGRGV